MTKAAYTDVLNYKDFESWRGNYTDCERDCRLYTGGTHVHKGISAVNIKNNSGNSSTFYHTNGIKMHMPGYTQVTVDFWFKAVRSFVETKWLFLRKK